MTVNFESLAQSEKSQSVADYENYQQLLRDLAAGKNRDENEILEICHRVDRNVAMFQEDVTWRKKRDEIIVEVRKEQEYKSVQKKCDKELDRLQSEFAKLEAEYDEKRWPLQARCDQAQNQLHLIWAYRNQLRNDCRDQNLLDELELLSEKRSNLDTRYYDTKAEELQRQIRYTEQELRDLPAFSHGRKEKAQAVKANMKDLQRRYQTTQCEIEKLQQQRAEIDARELEIREAMIFA